MVLIDDHDMLDTGECSIPRDVIDTGEGSIPNDVFDAVEGSNTRTDIGVACLLINLNFTRTTASFADISKISAHETNIGGNESDRHDPDFRPSPKGTPYWVPYLPEDEKKPEIGDIFDTFDQGYDMYKAYAEKGRFNVRKSGQKSYKGKVTHKYVLCNKAGKVRDKFDKNTLKECDNENEKKDGKRKRKRKTKSSVTNCPAKIGLKAIRGTDSWKIFDFVENHNHPLLNENNMDLSRARRQLHFGDYIFIHRASLSNIGPTIAHRLKVALMGGYDKVRGTPVDYRNFKRAVNLFIGDRDAQMIVDKMINRQLHVPKFSFEYHVFHDELVSMFWADETMKCNSPVWYDFVFVPFTGIDHNQKCVTFGAALLSDETEESYIWMLEAFLKVHQKQPPLALTDQDAALRNAVVKIFPDSKHRLCMWHITQKLPGKVLGDLEADSDFRKEFHKLIWNVYISPEVFEKRWNALINSYNLQDNKWLSDMYAIRDRWIPGYFKEYPMCGLMKTTSRSESSNAFFQIYSHKGNTFVQFMLCFESAMEKQRYTHRVMDNTTNSSTPSMITKLPIERHACDVYTHSIFREVQHEIHKGLYACAQISSHTEGDVETCVIQQRDKRSKPLIKATVIFNHLDGSINCSCGHYTRHGYLCRHIFCLLRIHDIVRIPEPYINRRWTKNSIPPHLLDNRHRYGPCIEETDRLSSEVHATIEDCVGLIRNDTDKLNQFLTTVKALKKQLEDEMPKPDYAHNKEGLFSDLLGVTVPDRVVINNPKKSSNKGSKRRKSTAEEVKTNKKPRTTRKVPFKRRACGKCGVLGHNRRKCTGKKVMNKDEVQVQEVEKEDDVQFVDEEYERLKGYCK
ncbi:FAR1-related sequence 5-like protein [Tanacetum coccineum]|uniref:FAR1-related sequence 5-like protein n=1 Tax=Tanacetum coccineum TaxID=301880 RepID=A0ABQ4ZJF4_9ASTR